MASADAVDVGPKHERADRTHREAGGKAEECRHQRGVGIVAREEGLRNLPGVDAEQKEVIHFEEIAARDPQNGLDLVQASVGHLGFSSLARRDPRRPRPSFKSPRLRALPPFAQWPRRGESSLPRRAPPVTDAAMFRRIALGLPGVAEYAHFDRRAFKARVTFATLATDEFSANLKFAPDEQALKCAVAPDAFAALDNAWGRRGWTRTTLAALSEPRALGRARDGMAPRRGEGEAPLACRALHLRS